MSTKLNEKQVKLVKEIWEISCGKADQLTGVGVELFIQIFTVAPALQNEFKFARNKTLKQLEVSPRMAIHASNFMNVIRQAVANVEDLTAMDEYLEELGFKHGSRFGAKVPHFDVVGKLLVEIIGKRLDKSWTNEHEEAWKIFYDEFTVYMLKGVKDGEAEKSQE